MLPDLGQKNIPQRPDRRKSRAHVIQVENLETSKTYKVVMSYH